MVATGTNYRLHSWNPDNFGPIAPIMQAEDGYYAWLFPVKKVLRDTYISQYTWYVNGVAEPIVGETLSARICLYRCKNHISVSLTAGTTYFTKVAGSEVTASSAVNLAQTQWTLDVPIHLEAGTYAWGVMIAADDLSVEPPGMAIWQPYGITDSDSNIVFPKWTIGALFSNALPTNLLGSNLTNNVTDWQYISGEWY